MRGKVEEFGGNVMGVVWVICGEKYEILGGRERFLKSLKGGGKYR